MSGYQAGVHLLDGEQALAFGRDRSGGDDFSRMRNAQILIRSIIIAVSPDNMSHWPEIIQVLVRTVETDVPIYLWSKLGITLSLTGLDGIETRIIDRQMVDPFVTDEGAQVLAPRWDAIRPLISKMFGE